MSEPGHEPAGGAPAPRAFDAERDVAALVALANGVAAHDGDPDRLTEVRLRELLAWPSHDPAQDRWVVDAPDGSGALIAHGAIWKAEGEARADAQVVVRLEWRRRGLGRALMDRALARARAGSPAGEGVRRRELARRERLLARDGLRACRGICGDGVASGHAPA